MRELLPLRLIFRETLEQEITVRDKAAYELETFLWDPLAISFGFTIIDIIKAEIKE